MDGRDHRVVAIGKTMAIAIVGISFRLSRPLPVTMVKVAITKSMSIETMAIDMPEVAIAIDMTVVAIAIGTIVGISLSLGLGGYGGEETES